MTPSQLRRMIAHNENHIRCVQAITRRMRKKLKEKERG